MFCPWTNWSSFMPDPHPSRPQMCFPQHMTRPSTTRVRPHCIFVHQIKCGFQELRNFTNSCEGNDLKDVNTMINKTLLMANQPWQRSTIHIRTQTGSVGSLLKTILTWFDFSPFCAFSSISGNKKKKSPHLPCSRQWLMKDKPIQVF